MEEGKEVTTPEKPDEVKNEKLIRNFKAVIARFVPLFGSFNDDRVINLLRSLHLLLTRWNYYPFCSLHPPFLEDRTGEQKSRRSEGQEPLRQFYTYVSLFRDAGWTFRQLYHFIIAMARFIIIDDTVPSGAILELAYARDTGTITIILEAEEDGTKIRSTGMTLDFKIHSEGDVHIVTYRPKELMRLRGKDRMQYIENEILRRCISRAEGRFEERRHSFNELCRNFRSAGEKYRELGETIKKLEKDIRSHRGEDF